LKHSANDLQSFASQNDWVATLAMLEKFHKQFVKSQQSIASERKNLKVFLRAIVLLQNEMSDVQQAENFKKQLSTMQAKAFNSLNQRLKKLMRAFTSADVAAAEAAVIASGSDSDISESSDEQPERAQDGQSATRDIMSIPREDVTFEMIDEKLKDVIMARGKKGVDRTRAVEELQYIVTLAKCPAQEVEIILQIISAQFDVAGSMSTCMASTMWRSCVDNVLQLLNILGKNTNIQLVEDEPSQRPPNDDIMAGAEVELNGSLRAFTERLDDEFTKSLQMTDSYTKEFVERLQDEGIMLILIHNVLLFYEKKSRSDYAAILSLRFMERIYCKTEGAYTALRQFMDAKCTQAQNDDAEITSAADGGATLTVTTYRHVHFTLPDCNLSDCIGNLARCVYENGDERSKARALLCEIFSEALRGDLEKAKEMLLMSHLQVTIQHMDISTQILFNRANAQLGLCAFEHGRFDEALKFLTDLFITGRTKELLAQGMTPHRYGERSVEQEKLERRRQVPQHLHINIELLETAFLVCAMLLEVSDLISGKRSRVPTRSFSRIIDSYTRQLFSGPPDTTRDTVMAVTKLVLGGEYKEASDLLLALPVWSALTNRASVLQLVDDQLKTVSLKLFLSQFAEEFSSASLQVLAEMFQLSHEQVRSTIGTMVASEQLNAFCDESTESLKLNEAQVSSLQSAASTLTEKILVLLDASERALDRHLGGDSSSRHEDDEPTSRARRGSRPSDVEEAHPYRSRAHGARNGRPVHFDVTERQIKNRDSYGTFSRKVTRDSGFRGIGKPARADFVDTIGTSTLGRHALRT